VRATVLTGLRRAAALDDATLRTALADPEPAVRRRAAELAADRAEISLLVTLADHDPLVVEMAAWSAGERPEDPEQAEILTALAALAGRHRDPLVREASVAAIGSLVAALGDDTADPAATAAARAAVLAAMADKPNIRRRAVLALVAFDGTDVDEALQLATADRDWQVRDAAEELLRIGSADDEDRSD